MKKLVKAAVVCVLAISTQMSVFTNAEDTDIKTLTQKICQPNSYSKLLVYNNIPVDNFYTAPDIGLTTIDIDDTMAIAKVIDNDFSLEMDLDVNSKKQLKPKATIIEGYKNETEKEQKQNKVRNYEETVVEDVENIDIDRVVDVKDTVKKQKQEKKERIAKAKANKERIGFLGFFKRNKTQTVAMQDETKNMPVIEDIDNTVQKSYALVPKKVEEVNSNDVFDADKIATLNQREKKKNVAKVNEPKVTKEKGVNEKVRVAKVTEPKVAKEKPVKVAKVSEPKVTKEKPVKVAKEKPVKVAKEKPVKVAKVKETTPVINNAVFTNAAVSSALGKTQKTKFETVPTQTQITNTVLADNKVSTPKALPQVAHKDVVSKTEPVVVAKAKPVVAKTTQPAVTKTQTVVAKTTQPTVTKTQTVVAKTTQPTVAKAQPVVAKTTQPAVAKTQPVVAKAQPAAVKPTPVVAEVKPTVQTAQSFKPVKVDSQIMAESVAKQTNIAQTKPASYVSNETKPFKPIKIGVNDGVNKAPAEAVVQAEKDVIVEANPARVNEPSAYIPVSSPASGYYKVHVPQETPVYSAFETMQSRLPLTRKPFDEES